MTAVDDAVRSRRRCSNEAQSSSAPLWLSPERVEGTPAGLVVVEDSAAPQVARVERVGPEVTVVSTAAVEWAVAENPVAGMEMEGPVEEG